MPLFEVDAERPVLVSATASVGGGFGTDAQRVVDGNLDGLLGEQIFPVVQGKSSQDPHLLALDAAGLPVVIDVVPELTEESLTRALNHAGAAGQLSRSQLAARYPGGAAAFHQDVANFYDTVPLTRSQATARATGARLIVICQRAQDDILDALDFLRQPGSPVAVLRLGVVHGADGRRFVDVAPLALARELPRSNGASAQDPGRGAQGNGSAGRPQDEFANGVAVGRALTGKVPVIAHPRVRATPDDDVASAPTGAVPVVGRRFAGDQPPAGLSGAQPPGTGRPAPAPTAAGEPRAPQPQAAELAGLAAGNGVASHIASGNGLGSYDGAGRNGVSSQSSPAAQEPVPIRMDGAPLTRAERRRRAHETTTYRVPTSSSETGPLSPIDDPVIAGDITPTAGAVAAVDVASAANSTPGENLASTAEPAAGLTGVGVGAEPKTPVRRGIREHWQAPQPEAGQASEPGLAPSTTAGAQHAAVPPVPDPPAMGATRLPDAPPVVGTAESAIPPAPIPPAPSSPASGMSAPSQMLPVPDPPVATTVPDRPVPLPPVSAALPVASEPASRVSGAMPLGDEALYGRASTGHGEAGESGGQPARGGFRHYEPGRGAQESAHAVQPSPLVDETVARVPVTARDPGSHFLRPDDDRSSGGALRAGAAGTGHEADSRPPVGAADPVVPAVGPEDDPDLVDLARSIGAPVSLVWARPRRGQRFEAVLHPDGFIELPDGGRYRHPDMAAVAASGTAAADGWSVWRLGDDGPTLTDEFRARHASS